MISSSLGDGVIGLYWYSGCSISWVISWKKMELLHVLVFIMCLRYPRHPGCSVSLGSLLHEPSQESRASSGTFRSVVGLAGTVTWTVSVMYSRTVWYSLTLSVEPTLLETVLHACSWTCLHCWTFSTFYWWSVTMLHSFTWVIFTIAVLLGVIRSLVPQHNLTQVALHGLQLVLLYHVMPQSSPGY